MHGQRTDATGRSTGRRIHYGARKKWKLEGAFAPLPLYLLQSPTYRALTISARRVLDFLMVEHLTHGGADNGNLLAPYAQLEAFGVRKDSILESLEMLERFGLIERTFYGGRQGGRPNATLYGLGWVPLLDEAEPRERFRSITAEQVDRYVADLKEARAKKRSSPPKREWNTPQSGSLEA